MKSFPAKLPDGRPVTFEVEFSVALFRRIQGILGINLMDPEKPVSKEDSRPPILIMHQDLARFVDAAYLACKKQADALQLSDEQFGELLDTAAFAACRAAFFQEWEDFFERLGVTAVAAGLRKMREAYQLTGARIDQIPASSLMTEVDQALAELTAGRSSTNSPV